MAATQARATKPCCCTALIEHSPGAAPGAELVLSQAVQVGVDPLAELCDVGVHTRPAIDNLLEQGLATDPVCTAWGAQGGGLEA